MNRDSDLAHDIRNPLNIASERLAMLREALDDHGVPPALLEHVDEIDHAHERIVAIVDDSLSAVEPATATVDLATLADSAWNHVDTGDLDLDLAMASLTVEGNPIRLRRLFENLYRNVVEHADGATTVTVAATDRGFSVTDDGDGFTASDRSVVLEAGHTSCPSNTGLGLAIARDIAIEHGWSLTVGDGDEGGARIEVVATGETQSA